jgi:hypothetical protein
MADQKQPEGEGTEPKEGEGQAPEQSDQEKSFWATFDERLDAAIERGVKKHVPRAKPGTQRTQGRTTLPKIFADFMGGPFKPVE